MLFVLGVTGVDFESSMVSFPLLPPFPPPRSDGGGGGGGMNEVSGTTGFGVFISPSDPFCGGLCILSGCCVCCCSLSFIFGGSLGSLFSLLITGDVGVDFDVFFAVGSFDCF